MELYKREVLITSIRNCAKKDWIPWLADLREYSEHRLANIDNRLLNREVFELIRDEAIRQIDLILNK